MRKEVREFLDKRRNQMPENAVTFTPQELQNFMAATIQAAIQEAKKLNPIEERKLREELDQEERKNKMSAELGKIEETARLAKQNNCSHSRDKEGNAAPRGQGTWTTQGQVHGDDSITLICMRCSNVWHWKATAQERDLAVNGSHGLLGYAPPPAERLIAY